jgi:hypothetical protein
MFLAYQLPYVALAIATAFIDEEEVVVGSVTHVVT